MPPTIPLTENSGLNIFGKKIVLIDPAGAAVRLNISLEMQVNLTANMTSEERYEFFGFGK